MSILKKWITNGTDRPFYVRKEIVLEELPKQAWAWVCGLGQFNFYINGEKVSDHVLDPAWTDYHKLVYYVKFNIARYLRKGKNVLAAEVGNGWYAADASEGYFFHFPPFMPPNPNGYKPFDRELVFAAHVELTGTDGKYTVVDADETWMTAPHMICHSNCFGSETVDGRKRIPGWNDPKTPMGDLWKPALPAANGEKLSGLSQEQAMPSVGILKNLEGVYMKTVNGMAVYDFGQNVSGMLEFDVKGKAGEPVHVYPAEKLAKDGSVDQMAKNWILIDVKETYIPGADEKWEHFAMTFTYFGGRYAAFDCPVEQLKNIRLHVVSSALEKAGTFYCDDKRFMDIYSLVENAVEANMVSVHTDCPTIERFAWQEENHLMAPAIMYMKQVKPHWEKFLKDTRLAQHTADDWFYTMDGGKYYPGDGLIPSQAPCYIPNVLPVPGLGDFYNVIGWGSSIILGTYWHYMFYGDVQIIRDNYEAGKRYLNFLKTMVNEDGFINNGLGDWGNPAGEYARENVETAFLFADAKVMAMFASVLHYEKDEEEFKAYMGQVCDNYNGKLLVKHPESGKYCYRVWDKKDGVAVTQAAQAMPLYWGMVPEDKEADVAESFRRILLKDGSLKTGEVGQPYIIQTMCKYGMNDLLCSMILKKEHPSYYAFVLAGETTLGEYWEDNPRSHCHDMMGHIGEWYYNGLAGIRPLTPGFGKVLVKPYLPESVDHLQCTYYSAKGPIHVSMDREKDGIKLDVQAGDGIDITIDDSDLKAEKKMTMR